MTASSRTLAVKETPKAVWDCRAASWAGHWAEEMQPHGTALTRPRFRSSLLWLGRALVIGHAGCSSVITANDGDAGPDAPTGCEIAPRPLAPTSTSVVTTHRPTLRWVAPPGTASVTVELCRDRACARPIDTFVADGATARVPHALDVGVVFWRLRSTACTGPAAVYSATWEFTVGAADTAVDTAWGAFPDLNGDGYADVAVGSGNVVGSDLVSYGTITVYDGATDGPATTPAVTLRSPDTDFGAQVFSVGDLNGDGYGDLVVTGGNAVYVVPGGADGPTSATIRQLDTPMGEMAFGVLSVAGGGDVNADGYADLLVGGISDRAWLFFGSSVGVPAVASRTLSAPAGVGGFFGLSVGAAGDVNGDGYADLVIGSVANYARSDAASDGAYVYFGGPGSPGTVADRFLGRPSAFGVGSPFGVNVTGVGDLNGDGYSDLSVEAISGSLPAIYLGGPGGPLIPTMDLVPPAVGWYVGVLPDVGDLDGDGFGDLAILGRGVSPAEELFVFRGGPTGPTVTPTSVLVVPPGTDTNLLAAPAGDVNGDGNFDLLAESQHNMEAFLYLGSRAGFTGTPAVTWPDIPSGIFGINVAQRWQAVPRSVIGWRPARVDDLWWPLFSRGHATAWWGG